MKIYVCKDYERMSKVAANYLAAQINIKPDSILGLATGSTPVGMYEELVKKCESREISFKNIKTFNLDEYVNLPKENINSYYTFMHSNLFDKVDINQNNINMPNGNTKDFDSYSKEYEEAIASNGGLDLQVLGIGNNAHIGFNEPNEYFSKETGVVDLTKSTIDANSRFFDSIEEVPNQAISMGIGTIFKSEKIILLASGKTKAEAINNTVNGPIDPHVPASILQLHKNVLLVVDEEAASLLDKNSYEIV
ncbi:MAG: glucosamine-6-phosphate deaminase [Peptostreptococcus sp.]|uniref:glucosamine-6-phosphate deaminase n=1 Tax=Peptostreptococcus sp. TaxID=1262 RepID=UPI002FCB5039